jgi:F-type H+-transporting ATPase subunit c
MNRRTLSLMLMAVGCLLVAAPAAWAVPTDYPAKGSADIPAGPHTYVLYGKAVGAGLGAALTIIGAGIGFGRIGGSALESMARQPETAGQVQTAMIIIGALLEGVAFFSLIVCLLILVL